LGLRSSSTACGGNGGLDMDAPRCSNTVSNVDPSRAAAAPPVVVTAAAGRAEGELPEFIFVVDDTLFRA
jgi:hypothetical protein